MIDELLVSFLNSDPDIANLAAEIAVGEIPTDADGTLLVDTYIWIGNFSNEDELDLDGESGLTRYRVDLECCSTDDKTAKRLGRLVSKLLQGHVGNFGSVTVGVTTTVGVAEAVFVESKDDDYVAVNQFTSDDLTVIALDVLIYADGSQDDIQGD